MGSPLIRFRKITKREKDLGHLAVARAAGFYVLCNPSSGPTAVIILRRNVMISSVVAHGDNQVAHHSRTVIRSDNMMGQWCLALHVMLITSSRALYSVQHMMGS